MLGWYWRRAIKAMIWSIPVALAVAAVLIIISGIFTAFTGGRFIGANKRTPTPTTVETVTPSPTPSTFKPPTGCLSHSTNPADFVVQTQAAAPKTPEGAAEFAGAWMRWVVNTPRQKLDETLTSTTLDPDSMRPMFLNGPGSTGSSTATLEHAGIGIPSYGPDKATVNVGISAYTPDGKLTNNAATLTLEYVNGVWKVKTMSPLSVTDDIAQRMVTFSPGC